MTFADLAGSYMMDHLSSYMLALIYVRELKYTLD